MAFARSLPASAVLWLTAVVLGAGPREGPTPESPQRGSPEAAPPAAQVLVVPAVREALGPLDVIYGFNGAWVVSDGILDQFLDVSFNGTILRSARVNLYAINLYGAAGKTYFNALDSNGRQRVGFEFRGNLRGAFLPDGYFNQGSSLAVRADDNGVTGSRSVPGFSLFKADLIYSLKPVIAFGPTRGLDAGPGGNFYAGLPTGIQIISPDGISSLLANYSASVNSIRACGDWLWVGTTNSLDWVAVANGAASVMRFPTPTSILSVDCGGNGSVLATGDQASLYYINPALNLSKSFTVQGANTMVKIAEGPGTTPRALILDFNLSNTTSLLRSLVLSDSYAADRNTSSTRLIQPSLRFNF
jgi:hypothetical protein